MIHAHRHLPSKVVSSEDCCAHTHQHTALAISASSLAFSSFLLHFFSYRSRPLAVPGQKFGVRSPGE